MKLMSKIGLLATIATSCMLAVAAPALAENHGGGGGHGFGGGGHGGGGGGGDRGYGYGRGWGGGGYGYGYGGAFLGGLGFGYALDPYYGADYDDEDPGQCLVERRFWDPNYGRYVTREIPAAC